MKKLFFASLLVAGSIANASAAKINYPGAFSADHQPPGATITCTGNNGHCGQLDDVTCLFTDTNLSIWLINFPHNPPTQYDLNVFRANLRGEGVYAIPED